MKRIFVLCLCIFFTITLYGCNNDENSPDLSKYDGYHYVGNLTSVVVEQPPRLSEVYSSSCLISFEAKNISGKTTNSFLFYVKLFDIDGEEIIIHENEQHWYQAFYIGNYYGDNTAYYFYMNPNETKTISKRIYYNWSKQSHSAEIVYGQLTDTLP